MPKQDNKLPYMRFYFSDLDAEPTLKLCAWDSCWFWVKMLGMMHHSPMRGYLLKANGQPYTESDLANSISGASIERVRTALFELEANGVFSKDRSGRIYCRKMVKGELRAKNLERDKKTKSRDKSEIKSRKTGDNPEIALSASDGKQNEISDSGSRPLVYLESRVQSPKKKKKESGDIISNPVGSLLPAEAGPKTPSKTDASPSTGSRLPADWVLPNPWGKWATDQGMSPNAVRAEAERFKDFWISTAGAKGRKADWQATWRNWIRSHLERTTPRGGQAFGHKPKSDNREGKPMTPEQLNDLLG